MLHAIVEVDGVDRGLSDSGRSSCPRTSGEGERLFQECKHFVPPSYTCHC